MCSRECHHAKHIWCHVTYCNLAQDTGLWVLTVIIVHDKKHCKCRWMQLQGLCPMAQARPSRAGPVLPAPQRRPAGSSPRLLPSLPPGPWPVALQRALIRLHHARLRLSSAGCLLTVLESGPAVPLPPPRMWRRSRMAGGVNPGVAHAVGRQPRHLAQVVLYSCCLVICRVKMLAQQCYFRVLEVPTVLGKATHNWTCIWA